MLVLNVHYYFFDCSLTVKNINEKKWLEICVISENLCQVWGILESPEIRLPIEHTLFGQKSVELTYKFEIKCSNKCKISRNVLYSSFFNSFSYVVKLNCSTTSFLSHTITLAHPNDTRKLIKMHVWSSFVCSWSEVRRTTSKTNSASLDLSF